MLNYVKDGKPVQVDTLTAKKNFKAPTREAVAKRGPKTVKIQYSRPVRDVDFLKEALDVTSAKAVGERTFDLVVKRQRAR